MESFDRTISKKELDRKRKYKAALFIKYFPPRTDLIEKIDSALKKTIDVEAIINSLYTKFTDLEKQYNLQSTHESILMLNVFYIIFSIKEKLFFFIQNKLIELNIKPLRGYIETIIKNISSDEIENIIKDSFSGFQIVHMIRSHQHIELHKELKKHKGKKISKENKKAYINIMRLIITNRISDSKAVERYNRTNKHTVNYSTFNSFKKNHVQLYSNICRDIKSNLDDEALLLSFH